MVRNFLSFFFLFILCSCVGTVTDKNAIKTETNKTETASLSFDGITSALAVSDTKIDVFFNAGVGDPADLKYLIYINDSKNPIEVNGNKIIPSLVRPGEYKVTVENLRVNTNYSLSVGLKNSKTGLISNTNKKVSAQTFMNKMADFSGILSAVPLQGSLGLNRVELKWIPAKITGGILGASPEDPIAYRIQYIDSTLGQASDLLHDGNENVVTYIVDGTDTALIKTSTSPKLLKTLKKTVNNTTSVIIPELTPGHKYYFLVRAIHTAYIDYRLLLGYDFEQNSNVVEVKTLELEAPVNWSQSSVVASVVPDDYTLSKKNLNWSPAVGPFKNYRVYINHLGAANNPALEPDIAAIDAAINSGVGSASGLVINSATSYVQLSGLTAYHYYNVVVATCLTDSCDSKISSPIINFRVSPVIAPFFGIVKIENPISSTSLNKIYLQFDPPIVSSGYLTDLEVYCMPSASATPASATLVTTTQFTPTGPSNCLGLRRNTAIPGNFANFTSIEIEANATNPFFNVAGSQISGMEYCFAVVPVIRVGANVTLPDMANMVTKCSYIQKKLPSIIEFPGSKKICSEVNSSALTVSWEKPTSGIYNGYSVFWKINDGTPFKFSDAIAPGANTIIDPVPNTFIVQPGKYYRQNILNPNTLSFQAQGLEAGSRYQYGVLAIDKQGGVYNYSEINTNINDCSIALPVAKFNEWIEIFAVGPKENGLNSYPDTDPEGGYKENFIAETLNDYGQPLEVEVDVNGDLTANFQTQFGSLNDATFNGAYGVIGSNLAARKMYSNNGIVRIAWKDISFSGGSVTLNDAVLAYDKTLNAVPIPKPARKYGYHVYRSHDNQQNWVKLTGEVSVQTDNNLGLLHPSPYYEWKRSNEGYIPSTEPSGSTALQAKFSGTGANKFNAVIFTDYSVAASKPSDSSHTVERARVYYYKVVPVVNGIEIPLAPGPSGSSIPQNIIKVVLPPPNMAYVSRLMANRQTCLELGKTPSKDVSNYYTCPYTGVGSRTLVSPAVYRDSAFVYDSGNDFLIDRFELGCNITRGSRTPLKSTVTPPSLLSFNGQSSEGGSFEGCYFEEEGENREIHYQAGFNTLPVVEPTGPGLGNDSLVSLPYLTTHSRQLRKGDCISASSKSIKAGNYQWMVNYPGFRGPPIADTIKIDDFFTVYDDDETKYSGFAAQSEFAAVHYNIYKPVSSTWYPATLDLQGKGGKIDNKKRVRRKLKGESACSINLPTKSYAKIKPRWIPVNTLSNLQWLDGDLDPNINPPIDFGIITKTMGEIKNTNIDNYLYDVEENKVPDISDPADPMRFRDSTKLGRVISSNAAKLPPIVGLDQKSGQDLCSTYEVQVGFESNGTWTGINNKKEKRLMRRSEGIIAGAWPKLFKEGYPARSVDAFNNLSRILPETNKPVISPSPLPAENIPPLVDAVRLEQGYDSILTQGTASINRPADNFNGSCNSAERANFGAMTFDKLEPGNILKNNFVMATTTNVISYVLTGSSYFDNDPTQLSEFDTNTQICTSRYGLQDLVGNVSEVSGEKIFCDATAVDNGATIQLFNFNATNPDDDDHIPGFGVWFNTDNIVPKGYISDPSYANAIGSCSMVNAGADRSPAAYSRLFTDGASIFNSLFDLWGQFTNLIAASFRNEEDPKSVESFRSADGFFLDFGTAALGAPLLYGDELALYNNPNISNISPFFSPVIGIPLKCPDSICSDLPITDNKKVSTQTLNTSGSSLDVANFPIGNSQFNSAGVLEVETATDYYTYGGTATYPISELDGVIFNSVQAPPQNDVKFADYTGAPPFVVAKAAWATHYKRPMRFNNFGSVKKNGSGRYGGELNADDIYYEYSRSSGARCAITLE